MTQVTKIIDSTKRVVFKLVGSTSEARTLKIDAGSLTGALNANNQLLSGGASTDRKPQYRLSLKNIFYDCGPGGSVEISTDGDANANTLLYISGQNQMGFNLGGEDLVLDTAASPNTTGNIYIQTNGFVANQAYTIIADFRKKAEDFNQGQFTDPIAFNFLNRSMNGASANN
jgi:hypothetical protein